MLAGCKSRPLDFASGASMLQQRDTGVNKGNARRLAKRKGAKKIEILACRKPLSAGATAQ